MGKLYKLTHYLLGLLCASALAVQALAAERPSVTIDANTGRVTTTPQTYQVPRGATLNVQQSNLPVTMSGDTMKVPIASRVNPPSGGGFDARSTFNLSTSALRNSVYRCLTSFRCNMAAQAGAAGFGAFMDGLDWVMTDGAQPRPISKEYPLGERYGPAPSYTTVSGARRQSGVAGSGICDGGHNNLGELIVSTYPSVTPGRIGCISCGERPGYKFVGYDDANTNCQYALPSAPDPKPLVSAKLNPVSDSELVAALPAYQPQASDWPMLSGGVDLADDGITIEGDFLELPSPEVVTEDLPDGTSRRTTTTVEPEWYDNPSSQPGIEFTSYTEVTIFNEYGDIVSNETTSITSGRGGGGGGSAGPIDCDFMPTVCRFINWFTEPDPEMLNEPDLKQLMETFDPDESSYDFGPDTMACPEPYTIAFSLLPSVEVSLQPICDVVDRVRPLVLALAYIFAGILLVRNI